MVVGCGEQEEMAACIYNRGNGAWEPAGRERSIGFLKCGTVKEYSTCH
jgi:hypothetical protein